MSAGARRPDWYVYAARITNAMISGHSPEMPIVRMTAPMPTSWSAMYGIVATIPVSAIISASVGDPWRPRTKSAGVT